MLVSLMIVLAILLAKHAMIGRSHHSLFRKGGVSSDGIADVLENVNKRDRASLSFQADPGMHSIVNETLRYRALRALRSKKGRKILACYTMSQQMVL